MAPTNEERLKEIEATHIEDDPDHLHILNQQVTDLLRIARSEMERANRRGELLKCCLDEIDNENSDLPFRIQKEIDQ